MRNKKRNISIANQSQTETDTSNHRNCANRLFYSFCKPRLFLFIRIILPQWNRTRVNTKQLNRCHFRAGKLLALFFVWESQHCTFFVLLFVYLHLWDSHWKWDSFELYGTLLLRAFHVWYPAKRRYVELFIGDLWKSPLRLQVKFWRSTDAQTDAPLLYAWP